MTDTVYRFGTSELDTARRELRRDGALVACEPKVYAVLAYLAERADRVVPREELREAVWQGEVLGEGVLARCIWAARRAVGDSGDSQHVIRTVQRLGYRFVAPVVHPTPAPSRAPESGPERTRANDEVSVPFVGRDGELAQLDALLHAAIRGSPRIAWIRGEAGAGKTRLAEEFARLARRRGVHVRTGQVPQATGMPPYWLWCQLLEPIFEEHPHAELERALGSAAALLAAVFPALRRRLPDLPVPPPLDSGEGRFRFFAAVRGFIDRLARAAPLLLILEDVHWADPSSLLLLRFLAESPERARWLLLVAMRPLEAPPGDERRAICEGILKAPAVRELALGGLAPLEIARLGELTAGRPLSERWARELAQRTEGNPLMVIELIRLLHERGALDRRPVRSAWLPSGARATIERRVDLLSEDCIQVLERAAALGRTFEADLVAALCERPDAAIHAALEEATSAYVIEPVEPAGCHRFRHALLREVVYARLSGAARIEIHARAGRALEQRHARSERPPLAALVHHFSQSPFHGDLQRATDYAVRAAEDALRMLAYPEAIEFYRRAIESTERMFPLDEERCSPLLQGLALAQRGAGDQAEAIDTYGRLIVQTRKAGDAEGFAHAVLGLEEARYVVRTPAQSSIPLLDEALAGLSPRPSTLRAHLLMLLANKLTIFNDPRRDDVSAQAVTQARQLGDPVTLSTALLTRHWTIWGAHSRPERLAIHEELLALADRAGEGADSLGLGARLWGHGLRAFDLMEIGDTAELAAALARANADLTAHALRSAYPPWMRVVQDSRLHGQGLNVSLARATLAILQGRFAEAERERSALTAEARRVQSGNTLHALDLQLFGLCFLQGRLDEVLPLVRVVGALNPGYAGMTHAAHALALASTGRADDARDQIEQIAAIGFSKLPHDATWLAALTFVAEVLFLLGTARHAREIYTLIEPFADRTAMWVRSYCGGSATRSLAQLATLLEERDAAAQHFETALRRNREMGAAPFVALTEHDYACMLARSERSRALELLTSALATAEELGMRALRDRAARSLARVQKG